MISEKLFFKIKSYQNDKTIKLTFYDTLFQPISYFNISLKIYLLK